MRLKHIIMQIQQHFSVNMSVYISRGANRMFEMLCDSERLLIYMLILWTYFSIDLRASCSFRLGKKSIFTGVMSNAWKKKQKIQPYLTQLICFLASIVWNSINKSINWQDCRPDRFESRIYINSLLATSLSHRIGLANHWCAIAIFYIHLSMMRPNERQSCHVNMVMPNDASCGPSI